jgi:nucleoid-associated protein EbfC
MFEKLNAMKQQMEDLKLRMDQLQVKADAHNGAIQVTANGNGRIVSIQLEPEWLSECGAEEAEELIQFAVNRALDAASDAHANEMKGLAGGLLPGMF